MSLIVLSHNVGSLTRHADEVLQSLIQLPPHICFLQEAHIVQGEFRAWCCRLVPSAIWPIGMLLATSCAFGAGA